MNEPTVSPHKPMRRIWIVVGIAFGLVITLAIVAIVIYRNGRARFIAAESVVRERGEPLHASEITFDGPNAPPELDEALVRLEAAVEDAPGDMVLDLLPESLEAARVWDRGSTWPLIEEFSALPPDEPRTADDMDVFGYADRLWLRVGDPIARNGLSKRDRLALEITRRLNEPLFDMAHAVCSGARDTCETELRALPLGELMPKFRINGYFESVKVPLAALPAFAVEGNHEEALRRWMIGWQGAQRVRGMPFFVGSQSWKVANGWTLRALRVLLTWLPPSVELRDVERELRSIDVRADTLRGLIGERALGNDAFDVLDTSIEPTLREAGADSWFTRLWLYSDRAFYLESMTEGIRLCALPSPFPKAAVSDWTASQGNRPKWAIVSAMLTPLISSILESQVNADAALRIAIVALIARREGVDAGRRAAEALVDPFDGKPLRTRVDPDGVFVVWSIGPDLTDDGASEYAVREERGRVGDVVWRVRYR